MKPTILIVDDEPHIRTLIASALQNDSYRCVEAGSAEEAQKAIDTYVVDVMLLDILLPGISGLEFLPGVRKRFPDTRVVVVSALAQLETALSCITLGADDFVTKPFSMERIAVTVRNLVEKRRLVVENRRYQEQLEEQVRLQTEQIVSAFTELDRTYGETLLALVRALDAREEETGSHSERVRNYSLLLARAAGVPDTDLPDLERGALLHDIGKIGVPDAILLKPGKPTPEEWQQLKRHPKTGYAILQGIRFLQGAAKLILAHHERYDGSGYPLGLAGEEIPLGARIFAFADTLDAMTSDRPYRRALTFDDVTAEIRRCRGTQFDPVLADLFLSIPRKRWEEAAGRTFR